MKLNQILVARLQTQSVGQIWIDFGAAALYWFCVSCCLSLCLWPSFGWAGVFNLPHFVVPGEFAIGVEPEILFSGGANVGANLRYTQGISDGSNLMGLIGTGTGSRGFRAGGAMTFDVFPDTERQPGLGLALQGIFVQLPAAGSFEATVIPYIHKSFSGSTPVEPFVAVPVGLSLSQGTYQSISTLAFGVLFEHNQHFRSVLELGIGMSNTSTYFSGGIVYYH